MMVYSLYDLVWFYLCYSFIGWVIEVVIAAVQKKKFINRGFVAGPLCPIYGAGAVAFAVFLPELTGSPFFLFLGGMILACVLEFCTGSLLEKIFHRKWWDYSKEKFSVGGYICLKYALIWGACAVLLLYAGNGLLLKLVSFIPRVAGAVTLLVALLLLLVDAAGTCVAVLGLRRAAAVSQITNEIQNVSRFLENAITRRIQRRMQKAFPAIEDAVKSQDAVEKPAVFAEGCGFYKLVSLFLIGAFLGDITETLFCLATTGRLMSRSSVVYGPFSVVWGLGCMFLTAFLYQYRNRDNAYIFVVGTVLGGAYEYICSVFTELVFGTVFWDYSGFAFNLGGRINLLYCFFWGIAAVVWMKVLYPLLSGWIERIPAGIGKTGCNLMLVFMVFNMIISSFALARYTERNTEPAKVGEASAFNLFLDRHFTDERIERIYPNAKIVES